MEIPGGCQSPVESGTAKGCFKISGNEIRRENTI